MEEAKRVKQSEEYIGKYGESWVNVLEKGGCIVVSCQEGLYRSKEVAKQLLVYALSKGLKDQTKESSVH